MVFARECDTIDEKIGVWFCKKKKTKNTNDTVVERKEKQREWLKGRILCKGRNEPSHMTIPVHIPGMRSTKSCSQTLKNNAAEFRTCLNVEHLMTDLMRHALHSESIFGDLFSIRVFYNYKYDDDDRTR